VGRGDGRRAGLALCGAALLGAVAVTAVAAAPLDLPLLTPPCTASTSGTDVGLSREHARSATTLAAVALRDDVPSEQLSAAVAAVLADETAPPLSADDAAAALAAPAVVTSDDRSEAVAAVVTGLDRGALTCRADRPERVGEEEGPTGLTPRAERLRDDLQAAFGPQSLGGFAPGGVSSGHIPGSAHYEGRAIDVFFRPVTPESTARGWAVAHWSVAHAAELDVATVIFDRQIWSVGRSSAGWRPYRHPSGDDENPILAHEDHVHVDVAR
jgi:hypothetical protein